MDEKRLNEIQTIYDRSVGQRPAIKFDVTVHGGPAAEQAVMDLATLGRASGELLEALKAQGLLLDSALLESRDRGELITLKNEQIERLIRERGILAEDRDGWKLKAESMERDRDSIFLQIEEMRKVIVDAHLDDFGSGVPCTCKYCANKRVCRCGCHWSIDGSNKTCSCCPPPQDEHHCANPNCCGDAPPKG